jgi:hypothetical protein
MRCSWSCIRTVSNCTSIVAAVVFLRSAQSADFADDVVERRRLARRLT